MDLEPQILHLSRPIPEGHRTFRATSRIPYCLTVSPTVIEGGALDLAKPIAFSVHAREKMLDRGATEGGIMTAIRTGSPEPARKGRLMFRKNFPFSDQWRGKRSAVRQVAPVVTEAAGRLVGVTVFVFSF